MSVASSDVALATVWDGVRDYSCAVLPWCQRVQNLAHVLVHDVGVRSATIEMLVTDDHRFKPKGGVDSCLCAKQHRRFCPECAEPNVSGRPETRSPWETVAEDCPQARLAQLDPRLKRAVEHFSTSRTGGCGGVWMSTIMYKWWAVSLTQYRLVLFADLDVQLLRPEQPLSGVIERWRSTWHSVVPAHGRPRFDVDKDGTSPINSGLWTLAWPQRAIYDRGLAVLERANWNVTHGFDLVGRPKKIYVKASGTLRARMFNTKMLQVNSWGVPFADCDQGFLVYMFVLHEHDVGAEYERIPPSCLRNADVLGCPHSCRHHQGPRKPWQLEKDNRGRVHSFLASFSFSQHVNTSRCAARFQKFKTNLRQRGRVGAGESEDSKEEAMQVLPAGGLIQRLR